MYLNNIVAHLEHDHMLHAKVLLHKVHTFRPVDVLKRVIVFTVQPIHDVSFEMLQQVDLALQLFGVF
jgi:hypothetical protein